jgi:formylmethanofuran--tetrahydromethanopterin N-formyltransferase
MGSAHECPETYRSRDAHPRIAECCFVSEDSMVDLNGLVEDTYAEAFRSIYAEVLITAWNDEWLQHCVHAVTGHASSTIFCDCEAGPAQWISAAEAAAGGTPDRRPGCVVQFHVPRFRKDRVEHLQRVLLHRLSQNVLTCPTAVCFNRLDTPEYFKLGRKVAMFGDGYQFRDIRYGERGWVVPILAGEFFISRRFGYRDGVMGGNLWFMGRTPAAALESASRAARAVERVPGCVTTFPGGVASSASKAGSRNYPFLIASTYAEYCPTLREKLGSECRLPADVTSVQEIVINGSDQSTIEAATRAAIHAAAPTVDLRRITAGNYGGRLGKTFIHLRPLCDESSAGGTA